MGEPRPPKTWTSMVQYWQSDQSDTAIKKQIELHLKYTFFDDVCSYQAQSRTVTKRTSEAICSALVATCWRLPGHQIPQDSETWLPEVSKSSCEHEALVAFLSSCYYAVAMKSFGAAHQ